MTTNIKTINGTLLNHGDREISQSVTENDALVTCLVETKAFRRLADIRFLGGIDYLKVPRPNGRRRNTRYTRYQHSLGVAKLAQAYCRNRQLSKGDSNLVIAAALLHDLGHAPLSHSLEPVFQEVFGIEHHSATIKIISGEMLGSEIRKILQIFNIDSEKLIGLISGHEPSYDGFFSGPINFDTIEGILRSTRYVSKHVTGHQPESVVNAAMGRASPQQLAIVDEFWCQKDLVYGRLINSEEGVLADHACQAIMRANISKFTIDDFFSTEVALFKKLLGLKELLTSVDFKTRVWSYTEESIPYQSRSFIIERDFLNFRERYQQKKVVRKLLKPHGQKTKAQNLDQVQRCFL